jgi:hypothetical protein
MDRIWCDMRLRVAHNGARCIVGAPVAYLPLKHASPYLRKCQAGRPHCAFGRCMRPKPHVRLNGVIVGAARCLRRACLESNFVDPFGCMNVNNAFVVFRNLCVMC